MFVIKRIWPRLSEPLFCHNHIYVIVIVNLVIGLCKIFEILQSGLKLLEILEILQSGMKSV